MLPHPIDVCWDAAGRPEPDEPPCGPGRCVVTGRTYDRVWPVRQFLSNSFTETARLQTGETVSAAGWCALKGWGWRCVTDRGAKINPTSAGAYRNSPVKVPGVEVRGGTR